MPADLKAMIAEDKKYHDEIAKSISAESYKYFDNKDIFCSHNTALLKDSRYMGYFNGQYEKKLPGKPQFGNLPVEGVLPLFLEIEHFNMYASPLSTSKLVKKISPTKFLVDETYAFPFPLKTRKCRIYLQVINNVKVDGSILFFTRSCDHRKLFWVPSYI